MKNRAKLHHAAETPLWWLRWGAERLLLNNFNIWRSKARRDERGCTAVGGNRTCQPRGATGESCSSTDRMFPALYGHGWALRLAPSSFTPR